MDTEIEKEKAEKYLNTILKISDVPQKIKSSSLDLLNEIILKFQQCQPFTNIHYWAAQEKDRGIPTTKEVIER